MPESNKFMNMLYAVGRFIKKYAIRVWNYLKQAKMEYIVMIALFAVDLISKAIINAAIDVGSTVTLIPKFLNFHNIHNFQAAFGASWMTNAFGSIGARLLFSLFAVAASVVFMIILAKNKNGHKLIRVSLAMLVAGAMGNCIDRMFLGYVRDFIEFEYFGYSIKTKWIQALLGTTSFYVFNIADAALVIGVILVLVYYIFLYKEKDEKHVLETNAKVDAEVTEEGGSAPEQNADGEKQEADDDAPKDAPPINAEEAPTEPTPDDAPKGAEELPTEAPAEEAEPMADAAEEGEK